MPNTAFERDSTRIGRVPQFYIGLVKLPFFSILIAFTFMSIDAMASDNKSQFIEKLEREHIRDVLTGKHHNVLTLREAVPSPQAAIDVALAVWLPIYGAKLLENQKPFRATRYDEYWFVTGTLKTQLGGTAEAVIRAKNGEVLNVSHGK